MDDIEAKQPSPDAQPEGSPVEEAASAVVAYAEGRGLLAMPLFFAASIVCLPGSGQQSMLGGRLRYRFADAMDDARPSGCAVGFIVQYGNPEDPAHAEIYATATKEREAGLEPGALADQPQELPTMH